MNEQEIFHSALALPPQARGDYLDRVCAGNAALRASVEGLLRANDEAGGFLDRPPSGLGGAVEQNLPGAAPNEVIAGRYRLLEQIGEGGMGTVWVAEQTEPVKRKVALKLVKPGMDSKSVLARFEAERQALALMDHPNIARVHDGGVTEQGRPYFVMELVKGLPLTEYCDARRLTIRERLNLFVPICAAVQHAHQKGVIHRDLKPSNILVTEHDGRPIPKIIDFGLAKALSAGTTLTDHTLHTAFGTIVGTPLYMAPEQVAVNALDVDTRTDVYSLGVILYELLTGTTPLEKRRFKDAAWDEIRRVIREEEPPRPSMRLSDSHDSLPSISAQRHTEPAALTRLVKGELDWIVMKALEKDRNRRYETANGFSMDVQRYLAGEVVQACPPSKWYRVKKFVRRNKTVVIATGLVLASLVSGIIGTSIGMWRAEQAKKKAEAAEERTLEEFRANTDDAIQELIGSKPELGPQEEAYLERTLKRWQVFADRQGDDERSMAVRAEAHHRVGAVWQKLGRRDEARKEYEAALDLREKLVAQNPAVPTYQRELAATHHNLGNMLAGLGERDAARKELEAARDLQKNLFAQYRDVPDYQNSLSAIHLSLGRRLMSLGDHDAARKEFETARDLQKKLVAQFASVPEYQQYLAMSHNSLGDLFVVLGDRDAARKEYETARDLRKKLVDEYPKFPVYQNELAATHTDLGNLLAGLGKRDLARKELETARDLRMKLAAQYPAVTGYQGALAATHNDLGILLRSLGERDPARKELETARDLQKKLAAQYPAVPAYQRELANTYNNLGNLLKGLGERDAARKEYDAAIDLQKKLVAKHPAVPRYQQELARTHNTLGLLLRDLGERDAARKEYDAALEIRKKLSESYPIVPEYKINLGGTCCNIGLLIQQLQPAESLTWFDQAIAALEPVYRADPQHVVAKQFLQSSFWGRAGSYDLLKKHADAIKDWDRVIVLSPSAEQPTMRAHRANSMVRAGLIAEAAAEVTELTKSSNWSFGQWYDFACVYAVACSKIAGKKKEYGDRAMELLRQAVKAGYKNAAHMKKDSDLNALRERDDFKKLMAELEAKSK